MRDPTVLGRAGRGVAVVGLVFAAGVIGVSGCAASPSERRDPGSNASEPAAVPPIVVAAPPVHADAARVAVVRSLIHDALPRRIWWRCPPHEPDDGFHLHPPRLKPGEVFVSDRPGGERLPGTWGCGYQCGQQAVPSSVTCLEVLDAAIEDEGRTRSTWYGDYWHTWVWTDRDGVRWGLYTRLGKTPDPAFTEEERRLVGRWRHIADGRAIELELLDGGSGRGSDGSVWEWISAEDGLELRVQRDDPKFRSVWRVTAMRLSADRRSYRGIHDEKTAGTRIDDDAKAR